MEYKSVYDMGVNARARNARAERKNEPAPSRPKLGRAQSALAGSEPASEGYGLGQFFKRFIEDGATNTERRQRSAAISAFLDRSTDVLRAIEDAARIVNAAIWEEKEIRVRELIGPLYSRPGRTGRDPIIAIAAQAGSGGPRSMGGKILKGAQVLREIAGDMNGPNVGSIDYTKQKVDTSLNAKRDWMPVGGSGTSDLSWRRLARISDVVGGQVLVMMIRLSVFFEPLSAVALAIEDDETALATHAPRAATVKAAGAMVRGGFKKMADRGL